VPDGGERVAVATAQGDFELDGVVFVLEGGGFVAGA